MKHLKTVLVAACLFLALGHFPATGQKKLKYPEFKGIVFKSEDETSAKIQFNARIQNRMDLSSEGSEDFSPTEILFRTRRMRLKAKGFLVDPRLTFKLELAFSRNDLSEQLGASGNILYDAYMQYALTPSLDVRFGQFKVPGNRERVVSSGDLALVDRSILNSAFNLDRDIGVMIKFEKNLGTVPFAYYGMISNGEGRNILSTDLEPNKNNQLDLAITQRVEILPLGAFEDGGDYFEADLLREETPKISIGAGYTHNDDAVRARGQRSSLLYEPRHINTRFADLIFKYQGWSFMGEYMRVRTPENPVTSDNNGNRRAVRTGEGYMLQAGYVWPSMWGLTGRFSETTPSEEVYNEIYSLYNAETETRIGVSKYIRGHRIKVQSDIGYLTEKDFGVDDQEYWEWRFQVEIGF